MRKLWRKARRFKRQSQYLLVAATGLILAAPAYALKAEPMSLSAMTALARCRNVDPALRTLSVLSNILGHGMAERLAKWTRGGQFGFSPLFDYCLHAQPSPVRDGCPDSISTRLQR